MTKIFTQDEAALISRVMTNQGYLTYIQREGTSDKWAVVLFGMEDE